MKRVRVRTIYRLLLLLVRSSGSLALLSTIGLLAESALPVLVRISIGSLVDSVSRVPGALVRSSIFVGLLFVAQQILTPVVRIVLSDLGLRLSELLQRRVMEATLAPHGISHLEDPGVFDHVTMARGSEGRAFAPTQMVDALYAIAGSRIAGVAAAAMLLPYRAWIPLALLASWSLVPLWIKRQTSTQMKRTESVSNDLRTSDYARDLALRSFAAKETRLFGLESWVAERFERFRLAGLHEVWRERRAGRWTYVPFLLLPAAVSALVLWLLTQSLISGELALGEFTVYVLAVVGAKEFGRTMAWWHRSLYGAGSVDHAWNLPSYIRSKDAYADLEPVGESDANLAPNDGAEIAGFRLTEVDFAYPGIGGAVFRGLNLDIHPGASTAIVGPNGAGKTTIVKLLARLYDPNGGSVELDGIDLRRLKPEEIRKRIAVIFQDFVHYEFSLRDNVAFGSIGHATDDAKVDRALRRADAAHLVESLPHGLDTILSRSYADGGDLSGGEWQRVALARAFMAVEGGAEVLILDEPTANLDVRAEAELFDRFLDITRGLTTILISHRMSSVRHADRICVIDHGQVVEEGTHDSLVRSGGAYSTMFDLQARHFREDDE